MSKDEQLQEMLRDLGRSLEQALASSGEIHEAVRRIRREGFRLQLVLDCQHEQEERGGQLQLSTRESAAPRRPRGTAPEPSFRLEGNDVDFLKALGIDPTRPARRRR